MAESKRATPAYAEDVDIMMVEYTAYNAVVAQLNLLKVSSDTQFPRSSNALEHVVEPAKEAARLSELYEGMLKLV